MISATEFTTRVLRKLNDEDEEIWDRNFILNKAQEGYDRLCRDTECIFDMEMYDNRPLAGNHTRDSEVDYMTGPILSRFNYTRESDREFVTEGALGPVNHTFDDEAQYMTDEDHPPSPRYLMKLPERFVSVDRVTHDWLRLEPEQDRYLRQTRTEYQTLQGGVYSYSMDQDGIFYLRTVGVPVDELPSETVSGIFGGFRFIDSYSMDEESVVGYFGGIRQLPKHFASGSQYGGIRRIVVDDKSTRVELFRLGKELSDHPFEIPDRAVRYVEWYVMYKALGEPGEGENMQLSKHFLERFNYGVSKIKMRVNAIKRERTIAMGTKRLTKRDQYLEMFPSDYGYKRPFGG